MPKETNRSAAPAGGMDSQHAWQHLINDEAHLNAIIDAMARCMGDILSLRNPEAIVPTKTLGQTLYSEKEYFPTREHLDELEELKTAYEFVTGSHRVACKLRSDAMGSRNVVLSPYTRAESFDLHWTFTRKQAHEEVKMRTGGFSYTIYCAVHDRVLRWMHECDRAMCVAFDDCQYTNFATQAEQESVQKKIDKVADKIARRLSLYEEKRRPSHELPEHLSARYLERCGQEEMSRTTLHAESEQLTDLAALKSFEIIAREGAKTTKGRVIIEKKLHHLEYVVSKPPMELHLRGDNVDRMNLELLARAVLPGQDLEVRCDIVQQWHNEHGACAAIAAAQAIRQLQVWSQSSLQPFIEVLEKPSVAAKLHAGERVRMPPMPFVHEQSSSPWYFIKMGSRSSKRTGLDWAGRRAVRLTSLVWQLLGHGEFERGVVSANIVTPVATEAAIKASIVSKRLKDKAERMSLGTSLLKFCEDVGDYESHLSEKVDHTLLHMSRFCLHDILCVFTKPAFPYILPEFSKRVRDHLNVYGTGTNRIKYPMIPHKYSAFAHDAMAIVLPVIKARREMLHKSVFHALDPVCMALITVPKVNEWRRAGGPLAGALHLSLDDVKQGADVVEPVLKLLSTQKAVCKWTRPYVGGGKKASKNAFVFNTLELVHLLSDVPIR